MILSILVLQQLQLPLQSRVKVVLYVIVRPPRQQFRDLRPLVSHVLVKLNYFVIFFICPLVLLYVWIQVVVPPIITNYLPFPALFPDPPWQRLRNLTPVLRSVSANHLQQDVVFFLSPRTFHHLRIEHFLPPVKALYVSSFIEKRGNPFPVFSLRVKNVLPRVALLEFEVFHP